MINVLIIDDHPTLRIGTKAILDSEEDMKGSILINIDEILEAVREKKYDLYLVDLYMPEINGFELTKIILKLDPSAKILIYTGFDLITHFNMLIEIGVSGIISKLSSSEQLTTSIRCAMRDEAVIPIELLKQLRRANNIYPLTNDNQDIGIVELSDREEAIVRCVENGLTNKQISEQLFLSQRTIEYNLTNIFKKLNVSSRAEVIQVVKKLGLLSKIDIF